MTQATRFVPIRFLWNAACLFMRNFLAVALIVALQANVLRAQELDSSTLQNEEATRLQKEEATRLKKEEATRQAAPPPSQQAQQPPPSGSTLTLPAGTKLPVGLLRPLWVKNTKAGDNVYLQITFPITAGSQMLVPPGTYVQGVIDKIVRRDRARGTLEFAMRSVSLIFSTGYTVSFPGTLDAAPMTAQQGQPGFGNDQSVPAMTAVGTTTTPSLPTPSLGNGPRNAMIAMGVAAAVGTTLLLLAASQHDEEMAAGTPLEIILPAPLALDRDRVTAAVQQYSGQMAGAPPQIVQPPPPSKICYTPGTPGTPDTVIPGSPGTPGTVIPGMNGAPDTAIPGTPATPDTVIPGTPGTPDTQYPCPK